MNKGSSGVICSLLDWGNNLRSNRTVTLSVQPNENWNGFKTRMWMSWSGPAEAQNQIPLKLNLTADTHTHTLQHASSHLTHHVEL